MHAEACCQESRARVEPGGRRGPLFYPPLTGIERCWFVLYVQVNHEKEVVKRLENKSIDAFLPLVECWSKRRDRRRKISVPLFPGYIFVEAVLDNHTHVDILKTPGALTILGTSEGPVPVPRFQIESLKTVIRSATPLSAFPYIKEGAWVQVKRGPLTGCSGILVRSNPRKGRLVVSVDMICKAVSVELDMEDVEPVDAPLIRLAS